MCLQTINWSAVTAIAASLGVIVALVFNIKNFANTRLSNSAKMVLDLVAKFDSDDMRKKRSLFANGLLFDRSHIDLRNDLPVLQFLEEIASWCLKTQTDAQAASR
jgi:hypothetical protein